MHKNQITDRAGGCCDDDGGGGGDDARNGGDRWNLLLLITPRNLRLCNECERERDLEKWSQGDNDNKETFDRTDGR